MTNHILSVFPDKFDRPLPEFNLDGVLNPGDYAPTMIEFEERFVNCGNSIKRRSIFGGWNRHRVELMAAGLPAKSRQILNGSYTSSKILPGDIDIAVEVIIADTKDPLFYDNGHPIHKLLDGPKTKNDYYCDAYPIYSLPIGHAHYKIITEKAIEYWTKWFGQTKNNSPKGRVWATTGGFL